MRQTCLEKIYLLAQEDDRIVFIGSDLGPGVMSKFRNEFPTRFFMEGISEQHIIGMAAGLAMDGFIPFVNTIASFLSRRCFEQIAIDLCLHDLPVRLIGNGGGLVYAPLGPTHQAIEDIGIFRTLPNMTVVAPCDSDEMIRLIDVTVDWPSPMYIRLAKGGDKIVSQSGYGFEIGKAILLANPGSVLFVTTGITTQRALLASKILKEQQISSGVLHMHTIKPFDHKSLITNVDKTDLIVTIEEHVLTGGLGSAVAETICDHGLNKRILRMGLPDSFVSGYGSQDDLMNDFGLSAENIAKCVKSNLGC